MIFAARFQVPVSISRHYFRFIWIVHKVFSNLSKNEVFRTVVVSPALRRSNKAIFSATNEPALAVQPLTGWLTSGGATQLLTG